MTGTLVNTLDAVLSKVAYEIVLNEKGKLEWHGLVDDIETVETKEPQTSAWLRFKAWFMKIAPESQM